MGPMGRFDRFNATFQPIPTVMLGFGFSSLFTDPWWPLWVLTLAFAGVYAAATRLFERLVGRQAAVFNPGWIRSTLLVAVGAGLGAGHALIPTSVVGVAVLMMFAVVLAWMLTAWWQRWVERQIYRDTLVEMVVDPEKLDA